MADRQSELKTPDSTQANGGRHNGVPRYPRPAPRSLYTGRKNIIIYSREAETAPPEKSAAEKRPRR
jgi:hypothetical protein